MLLFTALSFIIPAAGYGQALNDKILMTVAGKDIPAGEFIRMLKKSAEPGVKANPDEYLQQYINFKLKVADAVSEGTDTTKAFLWELKGYRDQLAQNYLTDTDTKENLLRKTYERSLSEINGWHILINCPQGSRPEDTLLAWQKAKGIRERILNGETFEHVAREVSDDPSARINGGNLGYFTVFQMISPFENAAYELEQGAVSMPVRTPYGYHIIKVTDRKPARGKVLVAHIMKMAPPGAPENEVKTAGEAIIDLYKKLQEGASFSELAKQFSDDKESASRGGKLNWFGTGEIISDFAEAALAIKDTGNYTEPVRSPYGWHIIKLIDKKPHGTFEEMRSFFESRINPDQISALSRNTFINKLKKEYKFEMNNTALEWFTKNTDTLIIQGLAKYKPRELPAGKLFSFADQQFSTGEFASLIESGGDWIKTLDPELFMNEFIENLVADKLLKYEDSILEKKYPDFNYLISEFHDGILLFGISERKIWNRVQEDSTGLLRFYEEHKQNYPGKKGIEARIYTLDSENGAGSLWSAYRKFSRKPGTDKLMKDRFNSGDSLLTIKEGIWYRGDDPDLDKEDWKVGVIRSEKGNRPSLIVINRIIEPAPLPFEEVRGEVMADYQELLENEWIVQLKERFPVIIDNLVFKEVKKSINDE